MASVVKLVPGDRVAVVAKDNDGTIIIHEGVLWAEGWGLPGRAAGTCTEGFPCYYHRPCPSPHYVVVAIELEDSNKTKVWRPYVAHRRSVRPLTRGLIEDSQAVCAAKAAREEASEQRYKEKRAREIIAAEVCRRAGLKVNRDYYDPTVYATEIANLLVRHKLVEPIPWDPKSPLPDFDTSDEDNEKTC